jgi:serine/threonine-protein kinase
VIDGIVRGVTPLRLVLPVGEHTLDLQNGTAVRSVPLVIEAGTIASHYIDLAAPVSVGRLEIASDPPGARVTVDGTVRGMTPLVMSAVNPGQRRVVISNDDNTVTRLVTITAGATSTVMASLGPVGVSAGWVAIQAPIELQVMENGRLIGVTGADRLMLPGGRHDLELVSTTFEFRTPLSVQIQTGKTAAATVAIPNGSLSINALPWAEVSIDGRAVGTTPLANLSIPIGHHEVVWRHPQLGERRQTVAVTRVTPVRVGVDLNR